MERINASKQAMVQNQSNQSEQIISTPNYNFSSMNLIIGAAALFGVLVLVLILALMSAPASDIEKARKYHHKAEQLHDQGKEEEAHKFYKLAEEYREKARGGQDKNGLV